MSLSAYSSTERYLRAWKEETTRKKGVRRKKMEGQKDGQTDRQKGGRNEN